MTIAPTFPEPPSSDPDQDRAEEQVLMLRDLGDMGMDLARALHAQGLAAARDAAAESAAEGDGGTGAAERACQAAAGFARVARTVRQTLALENRLSREVQARDEAADGPGSAWGLTPEDWAERERGIRRISRRAVVLETLGPAILSETPESEHEQLLADLEERLEVAVEDPDLFQRSLETLTARIRRELGLSEGAAQDGARIQSARSALKAAIEARRPRGMEGGP